MSPARIFHEGEMVEADELGFTGVPSLALVEVEDGARIQCTFQIATLFKLRDKKKADGTPIYVLVGKLETKVTEILKSE